MIAQLSIALAQLNFLVGDVSGNFKKTVIAAKHARDKLGAQLIVFPELSLTSYPPEDLLNRKAFLDKALQTLQALPQAVENIYMLVGHPHATPQGLYNACSLLYNGEILLTYCKQKLPNYGVFDENRYFSAADAPCVVDIAGVPTGILLCEDIWYTAQGCPVDKTCAHGAKVLVTLNASPFEVTKNEKRKHLLVHHAKKHSLPIVYVNIVGGQDELMFDGGSMTVNEKGLICQRSAFFQEAVDTVEVSYDGKKAYIPQTYKISADLSEEERVYQCLILGLRDYIEKNGFKSVMLGLSGGIDSALVAAIAVDALGPDKVHAVMLPSRYTSAMSLEDATLLANNLQISHETISIETCFESFLTTLASHLKVKKEKDTTEENLQARCRGSLLMALSNKTGSMVLSTTNRSELAMGYGTLYGDLVGGFNVLKDVPKTLVYRLARLCNQKRMVIPERIITRPPSAELAPNQKDEDTLPSYDIMDKILELYIEKNASIAEIVQAGFAKETVVQIAKAVMHSEYKRRQGPLGVRINYNAFGRDRRYPTTMRDPELQDLEFVKKE